jgi:hypothetical protein
MEPLSTATAFADVVSLVGQFISSRDNRTQATVAEYLEWLRRENHQELVALIEHNRALATALAALLKTNHHEVMEKLSELDKTLSGIASHFPDFAAVAVAVHPDSALSNQAVSILRQMNLAGASKFFESCTTGGDSYHMADGKRGLIEITERRFVEDDLHTLCELGLLRSDYTNARFFIITRNGAKVGGDPFSPE